LLKVQKAKFEKVESDKNLKQGCGSGKFEDGSGSDILSEYGSGSGSNTCILTYMYEYIYVYMSYL
jgi:hypothetical protein